ncbi:MAG: dihydropteroate synthase [Deltaproteobacteria bacterium]
MILVADNLNGLNPAVAAAMEALDPKPIETLVKRCEKAGSQLVDINPGYLPRRKEDRMRFLVETVQQATALRLILDSPNPRLIEIGLSVCEKSPIINALSMEETKLREMLPLAVEHNTDLVALLMDEHSYTPPSVDEKIALAIQLRESSLAAGLAADKLIFDPVLPNLSWDDAFFRISESITTVRLLATGVIFQEPARTMAGISNLLSGLRRQHPWQIEQTCLSMLAGAGLEYVLADVLVPEFRAAWDLITCLG